jgi:transcriptional regulator with XRE-family HTH domain
MPEGKDSLGDIMRLFRARKGLTQAQLAALLELSPRHRWAAEHGRSLSLAAVRRFVKVLHDAGSLDLARALRDMTSLNLSDERSWDWRARTLERGLEGLVRRMEGVEARLAAIEHYSRVGVA